MGLEKQINNLIKNNKDLEIQELVEYLYENIKILWPETNVFIDADASGYVKETFRYIDKDGDEHKWPELQDYGICDEDDDIYNVYKIEKYKGELNNEILFFLKQFIDDLNNDNISEIRFNNVVKEDWYDEERKFKKINIVLKSKSDIQKFKIKFNGIKDKININYNYWTEK